jgi:uncharacterized protein DUF922
MSKAQGEVEPESARDVARSGGGVRQVGDSGGIAAMLLGLQQTAGNVAVSSLLANAPLQRQQSPQAHAAPAKPATGGGKVGKIGGKRPPVTPVTQTFDDCNAAVAWLNSGAWTGDAQPVYKPTAGKIRTKKLRDGTVKAEVDLSWSYDASSTAEMTVPTWPNMTAAEKAAVDKYKAALEAHEVKHFDVTDKVVKALPKTVSATGSDDQDAITNLQTEVDTYGSDAQEAIDKATEDYDTKTQHGKTQSAIGGAEVRLDCPPKPTPKPKP